MQSIPYISRVLLALLMLAILLPISSCQINNYSSHTEMIQEANDISFDLRSSVIYDAEESLIRLLKEDGMLVLYTKGKRSVLSESFHPTIWQRYEGSIPQARYLEYELIDGILSRGDEKLSVAMDEGEISLGFWAWDETVFLVTVVSDSQKKGEADLLLQPLPEGETIWLSGIRVDSRIIGSDGIWNYYVSGTALCRTDGKKAEILGDLTKAGVDPNSICGMEPIEDGVLILTGNTLMCLDFTEKKDKDKTESESLIIGAYYPSPYVIRAVSQYNLIYGGVELRSFEDRESLNLALLSGEIDMIASYDASLLENYARRGVLAPLESVIGEKQWEKIAENVLIAGTVEEKLFMIPNLIKISGMLLPESVVYQAGGDFSSISELTSILDKLEIQDFFRRTSRENILNQILMHGVSKWVDEEKGECWFEDSDFVALLSLTGRFAEDEAQTAANEDNTRKPLFSPRYVFQTPELFAALSLWYEVKGSGEPFSSYGLKAALFPSPTSKKEGLTMEPDMLFAITAQSERKEEAEQFLSWLLSDTVQRDAMKDGIWGLPILPDLWEEAVEDAVRDTLAASELSEEEVRALYAGFVPACLSANHFGGSNDREIIDIVSEEAMHYFSGEITAEKAASYIQNRVSIFLAERG